ncbi:hypothetical protein BJY00DRAFT_297022 [Aspergillus carlsbadensis]|nr:hypothetical protein BJY00DRAFT_297022 [Aspergillus carlsbadensis]
MSTDSDGRVVSQKICGNQVTYIETQLAAHSVGYRQSMTLAASRADTASPGLNEAREGSGDLICQIAADCTQTHSFSTGLVNKNGLYLLRSLLSDSMSRVARTEQQPRGHSLLEAILSEELPAVLPRGTVDKIAGIYFKHCNFFSPLFSSEHEFLNMLEPPYEEDNLTPNERINRHSRALIVFGTSICCSIASISRFLYRGPRNTSMRLIACLRISPKHALTVHLLKYRLPESKIYTMLNEATVEWRRLGYGRLEGGCSTTPTWVAFQRPIDTKINSFNASRNIQRQFI